MDDVMFKRIPYDEAKVALKHVMAQKEAQGLEPGSLEGILFFQECVMALGWDPDEFSARIIKETAERIEAEQAARSRNAN